MEISSAWRVRSESPEAEATRLMNNDVAFSPSGNSFCSFSSSKVYFNSNEKVKAIEVELESNEQIISCTTIAESPWICGCGTNLGKFITISIDSVIRIFNFHASPLQKIIYNRIDSLPSSESLNSYTLIFHPNIFVYIAQSELEYANANLKYTPVAQKFTIQNSDIKNIQIVKYKETSLKLYITSSEQFLTVYDINSPYKGTFTTGITKFAKSLNPFGKNFKDYQPELLKSTQDYNDITKIAISLVPSPDKRFIAVSDNIGRITIIDVDNECVVSIKKAISDAQLAWYGDSKHYILVIYAPRKEALFVCSIPSFDLLDCIKLEGTGKLFQNYFNITNCSVVYMDHNGNIANLRMSTRRHHKIQANPEVPDLDHPQFENISTPDLDLQQSIIECLSKAVPQKENILETLKNIKNSITASIILKILIKFENVDDDFLQECIDTLKDSTQFHLPSPVKRQIENYFREFNGEKIKPEEEFGQLVGLTMLWSDAMKCESVTYPISEFPRTEITTWYSQNYEAQAITPPKYVPLRLFLAEPLRNFEILFATLRRGATLYDFIRIMMVVHPNSIDKFIQYFMYWCAVISASQLCMVQDIITDLIDNGQKEALLDCYRNIPEKSGETNKALIMKIIAL